MAADIYTPAVWSMLTQNGPEWRLLSRANSRCLGVSRLVVAVAPTKHMDRMEWLVEKLTEMGVNRIVPLLCDRSERREIKTERLEKIAVSAMKQSLKAVLSVIDEMTPLRRTVAELLPGANRFVGYCDDAVERCDFANVYTPGQDTVLFIGPEGDFPRPRSRCCCMEASGR